MRVGQQNMVIGGKALRSKELDQRTSTVIDTAAGAVRRMQEAERVAAIIERAAPPDGTGAAVAPARGPVLVRENWVVGLGGTRRLDGVHLRDMTQPEIMVAQALQRHRARQEATGDDVPFVPPFTPGQIAVARAYRDLVEWRAGSGMKCISVETGQGGGGAGSGLFIDSYIQQGLWLDRLRARVGAGVIMDVRRQMDRGNTRRPIRALIAVDSLLLDGQDLSAILKNHRWQVNGKNRKALRIGICEALDRMQGYSEK